MESDSEKKAEVDEIYQRFANLFANNNLSEDEKFSLSNAILEVIYKSDKEVI